MKSETLTAWEMLALEKAIDQLLAHKELEYWCGTALLSKIRNAGKIRLMY